MNTQYNIDTKRFIRKGLRKMSTIAWGSTEYDDSYMVLKWGINPYKPSTQVMKAISMSASGVNAYPQLMHKLISQISIYNSISTDCICITNGSDKAFRLIAEMFINPGDELITFSPSYPVIDHAVEMMEGIVKSIPLQEDFTVPRITEIKKYISDKTKLIYICNPNNPTANFMTTLEEIEHILQLGVIVVVDEAYFEFSMHTCQKLLDRYANLIILRSFSKTFGLAGLRVGYMLSSQLIIDFAKRIEESIETFNISTPSLSGALYALQHADKTLMHVQRINKTKETLSKNLEEMNINVYRSFTSFMILDLQRISMTAQDFRLQMEKERIILKDMSIYQNLSDYHAHIGVPHDADVDRLVQSVKKVIHS